jgi:hypothetical protein
MTISLLYELTVEEALFRVRISKECKNSDYIMSDEDVLQFVGELHEFNEFIKVIECSMNPSVKKMKL